MYKELGSETWNIERLWKMYEYMVV